LATPGRKTICSIKSMMLTFSTSTCFTWVNTLANYPNKYIVTLQRVSFLKFWHEEKNNLVKQYCCSYGVIVIRWTNDFAESYFTDWSAKIKTLRIVSKCHLRLCEYFSTIKQIYEYYIKYYSQRKLRNKLLIRRTQQNIQQFFDDGTNVFRRSNHIQ
jgi:hypothetical protein